ncbi:DMT family transporter [Marinilongibacter aquaticus]|uniref:DMT family transporter n=1 Tax=Marinilongibacter aquaticus TaxID=2975157 RepID=UPI0021BD7365|nr:DMT family transporter [Marinilongibacter aquaticus]UBM57172.1 DMT family transporter [Marinilongibacter aquaticus]
MRSSAQFYILGFFFAMVWASASVSAKLGYHSVQPLVLYQARFTLAAFCLLLLAYLRKSAEWPKGKEWGQLALFGFLNVTVALGFFAFAIKEVAAGIGALQVGVNPLVISVLSAVIAKRRISRNEVIALFLGILGVAIAVYPLLQNAYATVFGLVLLWLSTLGYSSASVYFGTVDWKLKKLTINAWQGFFGALFLLPLTFFFYEDVNIYDSNFFYTASWLGLALSAGAVYLWLWLLTIDTVRASFFLFLCPAFGFIYAYFILDEPFTWYTLSGLCVVMAALYIGQKKKANPN